MMRQVMAQSKSAVQQRQTNVRGGRKVESQRGKKKVSQSYTNARCEIE